MSPGQHARARGGKPFERAPKAPGDRGAGARHFITEADLAEATECPVGAAGQERAQFGFYPKHAPDGTTCAGPGCPHWNLTITKRDPQTGDPLRGEAVCTLDGRTNAMGVINRQVKPTAPNPTH